MRRISEEQAEDHERRVKLSLSFSLSLPHLGSRKNWSSVRMRCPWNDKMGKAGWECGLSFLSCFWTHNSSNHFWATAAISGSFSSCNLVAASFQFVFWVLFEGCVVIRERRLDQEITKKTDVVETTEAKSAIWKVSTKLHLLLLLLSSSDKCLQFFANSVNHLPKWVTWMYASLSSFHHPLFSLDPGRDFRTFWKLIYLYVSIISLLQC